MESLSKKRHTYIIYIYTPNSIKTLHFTRCRANKPPVKISADDCETIQEKLEKLKNEAVIYLSLEHPHIARLFDVYEDPQEVVGASGLKILIQCLYHTKLMSTGNWSRIIKDLISLFTSFYPSSNQT